MREITDPRTTEELLKVYNDLSSGLLYTHSRITENTGKSLEVASFLYALIELLDEKGLLSIKELDDRKKIVADRLIKKFEKSGIGMLYQSPEYDKYAFGQNSDVDCESRLRTCKALCCKFPFALSRQDIEEGIVRWKFGRPYLIAHDEDGYCTHIDRGSYRCTIYDHRPVPCKGFDCKDNEKWPVWSDFEGLIINHELVEKIKKGNGDLTGLNINSE